MTQYFKLTPITEKPEKEGVYKCVDNLGHWHNSYVSTVDLKKTNPFSSDVVLWLQPLPADTIVISEERLRSLLKIAHDRGYIDGSANNSAPPDFNQLIAELKATSETSQTSPSPDQAK